MQKLRIQTEKAPAAIGPYSQAVSDPATGFIYCSGQIGIDPTTGQMVGGGVEAEFRQVLRNVRSLLEAAGVGPDDVLKTTLFLADMGDFAAVNALYGEFFDEPYPARSAVAVRTLPLECQVELEIIARRPD